ncbi:hypothetical protein PPGU19_089560 (plasmid) [Paraburkholderia sp. PGU19]|nr:hypothetical protein PPGU19_089560 [Paraburkholderia sp. PGU19]
MRFSIIQGFALKLPTAAPEPPLNAAPAAAPSPVPMAALATALAVAAWFADTPPTWLSANCRHDASSARNWSNVFPLPGNAITLGAVGRREHVLAEASEASRASLEYFMAG